MGGMSEFLRGLPCRDSRNFANCSIDGAVTVSAPKIPVHVPTAEYPTDQVIVTEKTNILLRYLHWRWEKQYYEQMKKRPGSTSMGSFCEDSPSGGGVAGGSGRKRPRLEAGQSSSSSARPLDSP